MKYKYLFFDDYSEGAHPRIMEALTKTNNRQEVGYGGDSFAIEATRLIRERVGKSDADVHFISTGTHANLVALSWILKPYESVIAADCGHINLHETGAIEATGHKIHTVKAVDGKLSPEAVRTVVEEHNFDQMVKPRAIYISQSTELGTVYGKKELTELSNLCKELGLYFYIDGARLGCALTITNGDLTIKDIADFADIFYIGGTKNGGLIGEAMVIVNPILKENFRYQLRQRGALLAKARAVSVQFMEFFKDDLYFEIAKHSNEMAQKLAQGIKERGYKFLVDSPTNAIFPILPNTVIDELKTEYGFHIWSKVDAENSAIRLVTSWATPQEAVDDFIASLN